MSTKSGDPSGRTTGGTVKNTPATGLAALASPQVDPGGAVVANWLNGRSSILSLLKETIETQGSIVTYRYVVPAANEKQLLKRIAVGIMAERLGLFPPLLKAWYEAAFKKTPPGSRLAVLRRHVASLVGQPGAAKPSDHLHGLVAEFLLGELLQTVDRGLGLPWSVQRHDWAVTDPGGDCLALYDDGSLHFRLWESKAITGTTAPTTVVKKATKQLELRGWEYLGRWITVAQHIDDPVQAAFVAQMHEAWADGDSCAGAGISVSTNSSKPTKKSFEKLGGKLQLPDANKQGTLILATDFAKLGRSVRGILWKGVEWSEP